MTVVSSRRAESIAPPVGASSVLVEQTFPEREPLTLERLLDPRASLSPVELATFVPATRAEARALQAAKHRLGMPSASEATAAATATPATSRSATRAASRAAARTHSRGARHTSPAASPAVPPVPTPESLGALVVDSSMPQTRAARRAAGATTRRPAAGRAHRSGPARAPLAVTRPIVGILALAGVLTAAQAATGGAPVSASVTSAARPAASRQNAAELMVAASRSSQRDALQDETAEAAAVRTEREQSDASTRAAVAAQTAAEAAAAEAAALAEARRLSPPVDGPMSSGFGYRADPFGWGTSMHAGQDFVASCGVETHAAADGTVVESGWMGGYGWRVVIEHAPRDGQTFRTTYNHMTQQGIAVGTVVKKGDPVGLVGSTGSSTGCHVHFEVQVGGTLVDPLPYF